MMSDKMTSTKKERRELTERAKELLKQGFSISHVEKILAETVSKQRARSTVAHAQREMRKWRK